MSLAYPFGAIPSGRSRRDDPVGTTNLFFVAGCSADYEIAYKTYVANKIYVLMDPSK